MNSDPGRTRKQTDHEWRKGDDEPFWFRLGHKGDGLPTHFPMSLNREGRGPTEPEPAHHYACWCGDDKCPFTTALRYAWLAGRRSTSDLEPRLEAVLKLISPDHITPLGVRQLRRALLDD